VDLSNAATETIQDMIKTGWNDVWFFVLNFISKYQIGRNWLTGVWQDVSSKFTFDSQEFYLYR
jgi:hypothetical protein